MGGLTWVTNIPAPYRVAVWSELAQMTSFGVGLLAENEPNRCWSTNMMQGVAFRVFKTAKLRRNESTFYFLIGTDWIRTVAQSDSIILPGWENPAAWQILLLAKLLKKQTFGFYESPRSTWKRNSGLAAKARSRFFKSVDSVLTVGTRSTEAVLSMSVPAEHIRQGFNAVDVGTFASTAKRIRTGRRLENEIGHKFIYVGQLIVRKNVRALIDAFALSANDNDLLHICGDGPLGDELRAHVKTLHCSKQVKFYGYVKPAELSSSIALSQTLVLPSSEEVWGLVVNEALACGLSVVVTKCCGVAPDIENMQGVHLSETDVDSLALALSEARTNWAGYIVKPQILEFTPKRFATTICV